MDLVGREQAMEEQTKSDCMKLEQAAALSEQEVHMAAVVIQSEKLRLGRMFRER